MDIRFVSTLTPEDEGQIAPALMRAVTALLDSLPIAYTLRVETLGAQVFQHTHPAAVGDSEPSSTSPLSGTRSLLETVVPLRRV